MPRPFFYIRLVFSCIHTLSCKGNAAFLSINILDSYLDDIACLEEVGWMLDEFIAHLRDMKKTVMMNANVNKATKINNITNGTLELHIWLKIINIKDIG